MKVIKENFEIPFTLREINKDLNIMNNSKDAEEDGIDLEQDLGTVGFSTSTVNPGKFTKLLPKSYRPINTCLLPFQTLRKDRRLYAGTTSNIESPAPARSWQ